MLLDTNTYVRVNRDPTKKNWFTLFYLIGKNHEMNWNDVKIVNNKPSYNKRLISEMIHITKQPYGLNKQNDIDLLSDTYLPIIELLSPI